MPQGFENYLYKGVAELLEDPGFRAWVRDESDQAQAEWRTLLQETGSRTRSVRAARAILKGIDTPAVPLPAESERRADFAQLQARLQDRPRVAPTLPPRRVRRWGRIAAAVVLIVLAGVAVWFFSPGEQVYATGPAEQRTITLADGTKVVLNANTTLRIDRREWTETERTVSLDGEAYFSVKKETTGAATPRRFTVRTEALDVVVLGTRFNVHERRGTTRVYLEEGKVRVNWAQADLPALQLAPGELVSYRTESGQPVHQRAAAADRHLAWKSGHLIFDRTPLAEALGEIADIYAIELHLADTLLRVRELSSAGIPVNNLPVALGILEKALDLRIEMTGNGTYELFAEE